jgi:hypothetical protein
MQLRHAMSYVTDSDTLAGKRRVATHEVGTPPGAHRAHVEFPKLPSYYAIDKLHMTISEEYGFVSTHGGKSVRLSLPTKIKATVQAKIRQGLLMVDRNGFVTDRYGRPPMVQWKGDAANIHMYKAMKQTVAGMAWVHSALTVRVVLAGVTCPGCKMMIVEKADFTDPKTQMVVATPE